MIIKKIISLSLFIVLFFSFPRIIMAQVLFSDNFDSGNSSNWYVPRNQCSSNWQVNNNSYGIIISGNCLTETIPTNLVINTDINYSFEVDVAMSQSANMDRNFVFKYTDSSNWYGIHTIGNNLYLQKVISGTQYFLSDWHINYNFQANETYHFKIEVLENNYNVYINGILQTTVPEESPTLANYSAGLQASAGDITDSEVWFDNIVVTQLPDTTPTPTPTLIPTPTPTPTATPTLTPTTTPTPSSTTLPSLNVPDIKQFTGGWEDQIYDHTIKTIKNWGCALTSAAMVLQYHGHNIAPDALNNWLNSQLDGYIGNGLIN